jgi:hypothetical protein
MLNTCFLKDTMSSSNTNSSIEIYAGNIMEAGFIKSLLENADINAYLKDEIIGTLIPWWASPGGSGAVKVIISTADFERAKLIVEEYQQNIKDQ